MLYSNYIVYASLALYLVIIFSIPFRIKKDGKEGFLNRGRSFWIREISIFLASPAIILLCLFIHFESIPTAALCGCGVLGSLVAMQELFPKKEDRP